VAEKLEPRWGFHRLTDQWAARIVASAAVRPGELVLDIGAGDGALTAQLVAAGARVIAIELHPARLRVLRTRFADRPVRVVRADAETLLLPRRPFRVVANPPFGLTMAVLRRLLARGSALYAADLLLPVDLVQRVVGGRVHGAQRWSQSFAAGRGLSLPGGALRPAAPRPCAVLTLRARPGRPHSR
jgi:23S rRNA (adenine-N6)-dimethyltransferase